MVIKTEPVDMLKIKGMSGPELYLSAKVRRLLLCFILLGVGGHSRSSSLSSRIIYLRADRSVPIPSIILCWY